MTGLAQASAPAIDPVALNVCPCGETLPWTGDIHACACGAVYEYAPIYAGLGDRAGVRELLTWPSWKRAS